MGVMGRRQVASIRISVLLASGAVTSAVSRARADDVLGLGTAEPIALPPAHRAYVQYGVGLTAEVVASAGPACSNARYTSNRRIAFAMPLPVSNCIVGSGGGLTIRVGYRPDTDWYVGGAYEFSKQDASELYRLGILQQVRAEARKYFPTGRETSPFLLLGVGVQGYGNEWSVDTWGPNATIGGGFEIELGGPVLDVTVAYRPMYFQSWVDSSTISHPAGVAHFISFEVSLEARDAI